MEQTHRRELWWGGRREEMEESMSFRHANFENLVRQPSGHIE